MMHTHPEHDNSRLISLIKLFDSDDVFIKSIEYISPSEVEEKHITFPNALGNVVITFLGFESISMLKLILERVQNVEFDFRYEISFSASYDKYEQVYKIALNGFSKPIICRQFTYTMS